MEQVLANMNTLNRNLESAVNFGKGFESVELWSRFEDVMGRDRGLAQGRRGRRGRERGVDGSVKTPRWINERICGAMGHRWKLWVAGGTIRRRSGTFRYVGAVAELVQMQSAGQQRPLWWETCVFNGSHGATAESVALPSVFHFFPPGSQYGGH
ncbi:hypothetical protein EX30DRAFT_100982 [Ascodesmis nigricans]|uniref:DASH complex subunit DAD1 n=1 Tax=Ascodesmis nigricans TaxID=341454 RepID=A0A4S2N4M2_9PEZI|nr:hypothetical protein EX30DRAFT_100982 [Ascodesmis nigricans]